MSQAKSETIRLVWRKAPQRGSIHVINGTLESARIGDGKGSATGAKFDFKGGSGSLLLTVSGAHCAHERSLTVVQVRTTDNAVTFFLRDALQSQYPIFVPEYGFAALPGADARAFEEIAADIAAAGSVSDFNRFEAEPEESFEKAAARYRRRICPTFLGLARDIRTFAVQRDRWDRWAAIQPTFAANEPRRRDPTKNDDFYFITFNVGHGGTALDNCRRNLDNGVLPILHITQDEGRLVYETSIFATLENGPLGSERVKGTDNKYSYPCTSCSMKTDAEREHIRRYVNTDLYENEEQLVLWCRITAVNLGHAPAYAHFDGPSMGRMIFYNRNAWNGGDFSYDGDSGCLLDGGKIMAVSLVDGAPMPEQNYSALLQPKQVINVDFIIPHGPLSRGRACKIAEARFSDHLEGAQKYWREKLNAGGAAITVPERRINEMIQAGLLHCDLISFGQEPDGPLGVSVGTFGPIGSESAPIIEFFDCMGLHHLAERAMEYFFNEQSEEGFIQGFARYESETGPVLALAGNHLRYSGNREWVRKMAPQLKRACRYMLAWRAKNKGEELKARGGYGLIHGKVADADIFHHDFWLNAWAYLGLKRCAEALADIDTAFSEELQKELPAYRQDVLDALRRSMGHSLLAPTGDGSWAPQQMLWDDYTPDGLPVYWPGCKNHNYGVPYGPLSLVVGEVLDSDDVLSDLLIKANQYPATIENVAYSQPYYSRHDFAHISRGEIKPFLKTYYNQLAAMADPETYTFWEHTHDHGSPHKTHEEGWFLMQTRWMLYLEDGATLKLLPAVPRAWLKAGQTIRLNKVASYFGALTLTVESQVDQNRITAQVVCNINRKPKTVFIRLPHPEGRKAVKVEGGVYNAPSETVCITPFMGKADVVIYF